MSLDAAIKEIESADHAQQISYKKRAENHNATRSTLTRRVKGECVSRQDAALNRRLLHPQIEAELVQYIRGLTERQLMPTRQMIIDIVTPFCAWEPSETWVTRFLHRHRDTLNTAWTTPMDSARHEADSYERYSRYFDLLHRKIEAYEVEAENTYNMGEKGFMIGVIGKSKRIFDRVLFSKNQHKQSSHDGKREWVTVLASICGDGSTLPPCVVFPSPSADVQQSWVREITPDLNDIHIATSRNGWANNDLGLAWLKDLFDPLTKEKARRRYRLLIIDGHGNYVTKAFIDYCYENKILLFIFPPHATHTLQPLDVVCFKSLVSNYSNELTSQHHGRLGESPMNKSDFMTLFIPAWERTFTNKLVEQAFECTGIHPRNGDVILDRFRTSTPQPPATPSEQTVPYEVSTEPDMYKFSTLVDCAVRDRNWDAANAVKQSFHQVLMRFELEKHEKEGLAEALQANKRKDRRKVLPLQLTYPNGQGGAAIITPRAKVRADQDLKERKRAEFAKELAKTTKKQVKHQNRLLKSLQKGT